MKLYKALILMIIAFMIGLTISFLTYSFYYIEGAIEYDMKIAVNDYIGVAADTDTINFGMVVPGASSSRRPVNLINNNDYPVKADIRKTGNMSEWVSAEDINDRRVYLRARENRTLYITAKVPEDVEYGYYSGKIRFIFKKAFI